MTYGRQQLLWQKQVTVIGSIDLGSQIEEYHTAIAQFRHVVYHRRIVRRQRFALMLSFFVAAVGHSVIFFVVANVIAFYRWTEWRWHHSAIVLNLLQYDLCFWSMQFLKTNILQGSIVTLFRCGETCNNLFIANFLLSVTAKEFKKSINISWRYEQEFGAYFFGQGR